MSTPPKQVSTGQPATPSTGGSTDGGKDKFKQFEGDGVVFKAKLVGTELVMEPRGDKMCQNSIKRLKAIIKGQKSHKRRIVMKISYAGVKIYDEKANEILYFHEVPQISFIASDDTDARTFGYVCDVPSKAHQFICFKTLGPASQVMQVISQLFEAVLEKKKGGTPSRKGSVVSNSGSNGDSNKLILSEESPTLTVKCETSVKNKSGMMNEQVAPKQPTLTKVRSFIDDFDEPFDWAQPEPKSAESSKAHQSSVSLNDSALTRQSSFASVQNNSHNESSDKYAVFNDIDNLPSIFESTSSLNSSTTKLSQAIEPLDSSNTMLNSSGIGGFAGGFNFNNNNSSSSNNNNNNNNNFSSFANQHHVNNMSSMSLGFDGPTSTTTLTNRKQQFSAQPQTIASSVTSNNSPSATGAFFSNYSSSNGPIPINNQNHPRMMMSSSGSGYQPPPPSFGDSYANNNQPTMRTPSMMVPINPSSSANAFGPAGMIIGSAPLSSHQINQQHSRFSSSMVASLHQQLGSSAASIQSVGSAGGLSRQTNPFDDDFFS